MSHLSDSYQVGQAIGKLVDQLTDAENELFLLLSRNNRSPQEIAAIKTKIRNLEKRIYVAEKIQDNLIAKS